MPGISSPESVCDGPNATFRFNCMTELTASVSSSHLVCCETAMQSWKTDGWSSSSVYLTEIIKALFQRNNNCSKTLFSRQKNVGRESSSVHSRARRRTDRINIPYQNRNDANSCYRSRGWRRRNIANVSKLSFTADLRFLQSNLEVHEPRERQ